MNFGGRTIVLDRARAGAGREFQGTDACWVDPNHLLLASQEGVDLLDVNAGVRRTMAAGASRPQCSSGP